jgi:hypothetical protein
MEGSKVLSVEYSNPVWEVGVCDIINELDNNIKEEL